MQPSVQGTGGAAPGANGPWDYFEEASFNS
jgi:hypothetical protein